jgi:hypothetical protein
MNRVLDNMNLKMAKWFWLIVIIDLIIIQLSTSTFDSGDSVLHYLQAKQAFHYPKYFFDHWSKPLFVLLSSPFAFWGFAGMKLFNCLCVLLSIWLIFKLSAEKSTIAWIIVPLGFFVPELFWSQASGLTEPLFAFILTLSIYLYIKNKRGLALIIVSFLPFIRSEGWLILPLFAFAELINKRLKHIVILTVGHVVYGIIGWIVYTDFFWMFHQNPYQGVEEKYGSGALFHFIEQTPYLLGFPVAVFFILGLSFALIRLKSKFSTTQINATLLVYGTVVIFYIAHSLFWYWGLFHSFGLKRVFIAVIPLILLIGLEGLERFLLLFPSNKTRSRLVGIITIMVLVFPFTKNKMALGLPQKFNLTPEQVVINETVDWFQTSEYKYNTVSYANHYFAMSLGVDMDNPEKVLALGLAKQKYLHKGTIVFWDSYFAPSDQGVEQSFFKDNDDYKWIRNFETNNGNYCVMVFRKVK